jgi:hypothetical protein
MQIRRANILDISPLLAMLYTMHNETEIKVPEINPAKLSVKVNDAINRGAVVVAMNDQNKLLGSIGGIVSSDWWSEETFLADMWFYVYPMHRSSSAAIKLVKEFLKIGQEAKLPVRLGHIFSGDLDRKDKLFERLGLIKAGCVFVES